MPVAPKSMQELEQRARPRSRRRARAAGAPPRPSSVRQQQTLSGPARLHRRTDPAGQRRGTERTQHRHRGLRPLPQLRRQRRPRRPHHRGRGSQAPVAVLLRLLPRRRTVIELPIGSYVPSFAPPEPPAEPEPAAARRSLRSRTAAPAHVSRHRSPTGVSGWLLVAVPGWRSLARSASAASASRYPPPSRHHRRTSTASGNQSPPAPTPPPSASASPPRTSMSAPSIR